ncbi:MAG: hypothetical protein P1U77_21645 [Rubripirellula sp.]|nr:hypothetical protein [Rubripirellula sp.]
MPRGSAPFRSRDSDDFADDFVTRGAISMGSIGGVRCLISYSVPAGLLVLLGVVTFAADRPGSTADLPPSAMLATAFWASGWVVQAAFFWGLSKLLGAPATYLRVGLLGVESMPRVWTVNQAGLVSIATLIPILLLGMFYRLIEGGFSMPQLAPAEQAVWLPPSVGLKSHESIWLTGAWLCWVQVVLQMIPFPRTPGRQLLAAMVVGMGRSLPPPIQVRLLRQMLIVVSIGFVVLSLLLHSSDNSGLASKWPLLLLGGILMFISSRSFEVASLVDGLRQGHSSLGHLPRESWVQRTRHSLAQRRDRVRLQRAMKRERGEAADAQRLDEILHRLHHDGVQSLSVEDRRILDRVSENLRRERGNQESTK